MDSALLGYDTYRINNDRSWTSGPLTMKALHSFETSDIDTPVTQRYIPADLSPHAHRQPNLKTRMTAANRTIRFVRYNTDKLQTTSKFLARNHL